MEYWTLKSLKALAVSCICCTLIACGGGGSSSAETGNSPTSSNLVGTSSNTADTSSNTVDTSSNTADTSSPSNSRTLELSWLIPDAREDGSDLYAYEIAGYLIYYISSDAPMEQADAITIDDHLTTDYTFKDLPSGNYRLAIATVDTQGIQSGLSDEVTAIIP